MINEQGDVSMRFSVITVVFNAKQTLEAAINSVLSQDNVEIEYIIIDGGSSDGSVDIIKKYEHSLAYWVSEPDHGIYDAMNKGISHCTGDVISFLGADDTYLPGAFLNIMKFINNNSEMDLFCFNVQKKVEGKIVARKQRFDSPEFLLTKGMIYCHQGIFAKKYLFDDNKFNTKYEISSDYEWTLKQYKLGRKIIYFHEVVAIYNCGGVSSNDRKTIREATNIAMSYSENDKQRRDIIRRMKTLMFKYMIYNEDDIKKYIDINKIRLLNNRNVLLFGAGELGLLWADVLKKYDINIKAFVDNDSSKKQMCDVPVIQITGQNTNKDIIVITMADYYGEAEEQLNSYDYCYCENYFFISDFLYDEIVFGE